MLTEKQIASAIKKYNDIMEMIGYEHNTIGTSLSEDTENWNLRDMVAECDYTLSTYYEWGHCNAEMKDSDDEYERKMWRSETAKLKRFIEHWKPYISDMKCSVNHCSNFDNA
jgi:hypothetical protein